LILIDGIQEAHNQFSQCWKLIRGLGILLSVCMYVVCMLKSCSLIFKMGIFWVVSLRVNYYNNGGRVACHAADISTHPSAIYDI